MRSGGMKPKMARRVQAPAGARKATAAGMSRTAMPNVRPPMQMAVGGAAKERRGQGKKR